MDLKVDKKKSSLKTCYHCQTTKTPLWRGGPGGPQSLCNACGIKYHKRRRQLSGLNVGKNGLKKKKRSKVSRRRKPVRDHLKMRFMGFEEFREEERAAILLMALSCGSAYA